MTAMAYKGYTAHTAFDSADELFFGRVADIDDVVGFHAESVEALKTAFHEAVDDYILASTKPLNSKSASL